MSFGITTYFPSNRQWDFITLALPAQTGTGDRNNLAIGIGGTTNYTASGEACDVSDRVP